MKNLLYQKRRPSLEKILGWIFATVSILLLCIQILYYAVLLPNGFQAIYDWLPYCLNGGILIFGAGALICLLLPGKKGLFFILSGFFLLFTTDLVFFFLFGTSCRTEVRFSPQGGNQVIVKQEKESGTTRVYRHPILWVLAKPSDEFPHPVQGDMKFQWITSDICTITYQTDGGETHQYTATYGERGDGISYFYVLNALRGSWINSDEGQPAPLLNVGADEIVLTSTDGTKRLRFSAENCVQFGTTSLTLCTEDGIPLYSLSMDENCTLDQNDNVRTGGTLLLCPVSMEDTDAFFYERVSTPPESAEQRT